MNLLKISIAYLLHYKLQTALSMIILAFGIIIITLLLLVNEQVKTAMEKNISEVDMVIGAKGSPLQFILSSLFHIDFPTGNISMEDADFIAGHRLVKNAIPVSIGDSYEGFRIIGTDTGYYGLFDLEIAEGTYPHSTLEVIAGQGAAQKLQLKTGDTFTSSHGFSDDGGHGEFHFKITGILKPTGRIQDDLLFTPLASYWEVHETDTSNLFITNLLLQFRNPMAAVQLPRLVNNTSNLQAAMPAFEVSRLLSMLGAGAKFLNLLAFLMVGIAVMSIFITMFTTLNQRRYDMAIFRTMGATKKKQFLFILFEGIIISFSGTISGIAISHLILWVINFSFEGNTGLMLSGEIFNVKELYILALGTATGIAGAIIPAVSIYRTDISKILSESQS